MPGRSDLCPYQERAVDWIKAHENCALWLDMGLGKTVSALTAYADLLATFDARHALVIAPLRVARRVWDDEIRAWEHVSHLTTSRAIGSAAKRWLALKRPADIHLINRENVQWLEAQIIQGKKQVRRWPWDLVILDESQSFRSQSSNRFKSMRRLRKLFPRMVQLTGTPAPNGYHNLWSQMYLLDHGQRLGGSERAFYDRWFDTEITSGGFARHTLRPGADEQIQRAVSDIVMSLKAEDYLTLPPVRWNDIFVDLPDAALKTYRRLEREALAEIKSRTVTAVNAGVACGKLLQLANGAVYHDDKKWVALHDAKLEALLETLDGISTPTLVCYGFRHDLARMQIALRTLGKRVAVLDTPTSEAQWDRGEVDIMLMHPASAGHGLNLQHAGCKDLIWFGLTNDLELFDQANARIMGGHRRTEGLTIHRILSSRTIDEDVAALLRRKGDRQTGLMQALVRRALA